MKDKKSKKNNDGLRSEYDFDYSKGVRGKYYNRIKNEGSNIVMLEPDVAAVFTDSASVNDALRSLLSLIRVTNQLKKRSRNKFTSQN